MSLKIQKKEIKEGAKFCYITSPSMTITVLARAVGTIWNVRLDMTGAGRQMTQTHIRKYYMNLPK